jgi:hypothetical protein
MNQISAKLAELLLGSGDHTGNLDPLVGQRRHDVIFRHIHPRSQNDRGDYLLQADMMSAMRLVFMRHDTGKMPGPAEAGEGRHVWKERPNGASDHRLGCLEPLATAAAGVTVPVSG